MISSSVRSTFEVCDIIVENGTIRLEIREAPTQNESFTSIHEACTGL